MLKSVVGTITLLKCLSFTGLFLFVISTAAQDPEFSQFYANQMYLNPALTGVKPCPRVSLNYRNQWPNLSGKLITSAFSYDQRVDALSGGIGLLFVSDNAAKTMVTNRVGFTYAYSKQLDRAFTINAGMEVTYFQKYLDWDKLSFGDQIDPRRGFVFQTQDIPRSSVRNGLDFSAGIVGYSDVIYAGFAVHHLNEPDESFLKSAEAPLPMKITAHAGGIIPIEHHHLTSGLEGVKDYISPNILFRKQGIARQLNMGLYLKSGSLIAGLWYRNRDAFMFLVGVEQGRIRMGYSYDVTTSSLSVRSGGAHEISLGIDIQCKPKKKSYRFVSCPSF